MVGGRVDERQGSDGHMDAWWGCERAVVYKVRHRLHFRNSGWSMDTRLVEDDDGQENKRWQKEASQWWQVQHGEKSHGS